MLLTDNQSDAMAELINIAFARTAASLSELSGHRVLLDAPNIEVQAIEASGAVGTHQGGRRGPPDFYRPSGRRRAADSELRRRDHVDRSVMRATKPFAPSG